MSERNTDLTRYLIWEIGEYLDYAIEAALGRKMTDEELGILGDAQDALRLAVCSIAGHDVEDDQCMRPDHRFCLACFASCPDQPVGRAK